MKIGIVDDHPFILQAYKNTLSNYEVVLSCVNGHEMIETLKSLDTENLPQLIILDLNMPVMNGYDSAKWMKKNYPEIKIVIATTSNLETDVIRLIKLGIEGYIFKQDLTFEELRRIVKQIEEIGTYYPKNIAKILAKSVQNKVINQDVEKLKFEMLTSKEKQILKLIAKEFSSSEISAELLVTSRTIENHKQNIFIKLGVRTSIGAALFAQRIGLLKE